MIWPLELAPIDMSDCDVNVSPLTALIGVPSQAQELTVRVPVVLMTTEPVELIPSTSNAFELLLM
jgi:hypothetical protein